MMIYKILRADEWADLRAQGETAGAPVDVADGFVHFSTAPQVHETLRRHFAGEAGLHLLTGKIDITSQNHGFALQAPDNYDLANEDAEFASDFGPAHITHICLNDDTVEGVALRNGMAFSVQYHPESAAGPHDANPLFDQFEELMANHTPNK